MRTKFSVITSLFIQCFPRKYFIGLQWKLHHQFILEINRRDCYLNSPITRPSKWIPPSQKCRCSQFSTAGGGWGEAECSWCTVVLGENDLPSGGVNKRQTCCASCSLERGEINRTGDVVTGCCLGLNLTLWWHHFSTWLQDAAHPPAQPRWCRPLLTAEQVLGEQSQGVWSRSTRCTPFILEFCAFPSSVLQFWSHMQEGWIPSQPGVVQGSAAGGCGTRRWTWLEGRPREWGWRARQSQHAYRGYSRTPKHPVRKM